jgi:transposase
MAMHPTESKNIAVNHVRGKVVKIQQQMGIQKNAVKKLSDPSHLRSSLRGLTRTFGVARNTVKDWLKKSEQTASLERNTR